MLSLAQLWRDVRFAVRSLRRAPGFSLAVIITYALCVGPNAAIFAVLYGLVLNPLPFRDASRLVQVTSDLRDGSRRNSSLAQYLDFKAHADLFAGFGVERMENSTIGEVSPLRIYGMRVSSDFFSVLGVRPFLGRFPTAEEETVGQDHVVVLARSFWEQQYNADPSLVGRTIRMGGEPFTVIGIAPRSLEVLDVYNDFWKPYERTPEEVNPRARNTLAILWARLKPGVPAEAAQAQLETIEHRFLTDQASPQLRAFEERLGQHIALHRPLEQLPAINTAILLLQCGAACVLLVGCVNVANLLLARANAKRAEFAIRSALGAGRTLILRQLPIESLLLTTVGAGVGILLTLASLRVINTYLPTAVQSAAPIAMGPAVFGYILLFSLAAGFAIGMLPFALLWREGLHLQGSRTASAGHGLRLFSSIFVIAQVAVALILLVGAGLLLTSLSRVLAVLPGFDAVHTVQFRVALPRSYSQQTNVLAQQRIVAAMRDIPGVTAATRVWTFPVNRNYSVVPFIVRGADRPTTGVQPQVYTQSVGANFFATLGIPVVQGRDFAEMDFTSTIPVVVVDQKFAQQNFPRGDAVGHDLTLGAFPPTDPKQWLRIVGVIARANLAGLDERDGPPFVYFPLNQSPVAGFNVVVRTSRALPDILGAMREALRNIDPTLPFYAADSLQNSIDNLLTRRRGIVLFVGLFADLALVLAGVGLYGMLAYDVSLRTREIGIRAALGAGRRQIIALIVRQGIGKAAIGLGAGLLGALYLTRFIRGALFDVQPADPTVYLVVSFVLLAVASLASYIPARRATKVDPIVALRCE